jgi:uncharacterized protein
MNHTAKTNLRDPGSPVQHGFHLMAKPGGPACNLGCAYCFYREKRVFFPEKNISRMSDAVLEAYTREYIRSQPGSSVVFEWQGGEPCLAGLDFFQKALDFQKHYGAGKQISNAFQTNGTLLDAQWCDFFAKNGFLVGLSLDGPEPIHDAFRVDVDGQGTFGKVLDSLRMLREYGVEVNVLAAVNRKSASFPREVYRFFRDQGVRFIQFVPIVEREADSLARSLGIPLAAPPALTEQNAAVPLTSWSVEPEQYGEFLVQVFDEWMRHDVGRIFVMNFEWALGAWVRPWVGGMPGVCYLAPRCGRNLIIETNGDIFSCDHFMYPAYRLGNILEDDLGQLVRSAKQTGFGALKEMALPGSCRKCNFLFACRGGCPKHRFATSCDGEPGLNYLCAGFKTFYRHVSPAMHRMTDCIRKGIPVQTVMETASV